MSWSIWSVQFQSLAWNQPTVLNNLITSISKLEMKYAYTWLDWAGHFYTQTCAHVWLWYDWVVQLQSKTWSHEYPWAAWADQDETLTWPHEVLINLSSSSYHSDRLIHSSDQFEHLNSDIDIFINLISMGWSFAESDMKPSIYSYAHKLRNKCLKQY